VGSWGFPTDGLVSYWSMDSVSGTTVFDDFGTNDATTVNNPTISSLYGKRIDGARLGDIGGTLEQISAPLSGFANATEMTYSLWVRFDESTTGAKTLYLQGGSNENNENAARIYSGSLGGILTLEFQKFGSGKITINDIYTNYGFSNWVHFAFVFDGSLSASDKIKAYINGTRITPDTIEAPIHTELSPLLGSTLFIGGGNVTDRTSSYDEFMVFDSALSSNTISEIYNSGEGKFYTP